MDERYKLLQGNAVDVLKTLPDCSVDCCITSPPYYALRDYGTGEWVGGDKECDHVANPHATKVQGNPMFNENRPSREATHAAGFYSAVCPKCGAVRKDEQIGLEETPEQFIDRLVQVFHEVKRVLKDDGTCWINIGDSYWGSGSRGMNFTDSFTEKSKKQMTSEGTIDLSNIPSLKGNVRCYKNKDLIGIPWMLAFALRADGWYLRQDIIWAKTNCMPESVTDRCTKSHEYIFLLSKSPKYFYDADAIKTDSTEESLKRCKYAFFTGEAKHGKGRPGGGINTAGMKENCVKLNKRDVWFVNASGGYTDENGGHYATFNPKLIEPCVLAGCRWGG